MPDEHGHDDCLGCHDTSAGNARAAAAVQEQRADVDNTAWDGGAAMSACASSDTPASCYSSICAGKKAGDPAKQSSHALPHHKNPGDAPNAAGVRNALSRLPQTDGLTNAAAAKTHLEAHMSVIEAAEKAAGTNSWERPGATRAASLPHRRQLSGTASRLHAFRAHFRHEPVTVNGKSLHQLEGYASVTGVDYEMYDMFGPYMERVAATAFDETLAADPDVAFLVNHKGLTMARTKSGTLKLDADPRGLHSLAYVNPERNDVHDLLIAIDDNDVTEMSFAFYITDGEWDEEYENFTINSVDINRGDVSAVNYGANPYTNIEGRSAEVLDDIDHLPRGAQYAAYVRLARSFGEAPVLHGPAARAARGALAPDGDTGVENELIRRSIANGGDPVAQAAQGRSTAYYETLLRI